MEKVRIGLIGAGNIANTHLNAYKSVPEAEIVAICDINEKHLNEPADKFGIEARYTSLEDMLASEKLDAADVCVWNCNHAKCTIAALNAGLHVLCEKPMATSAKEAEEMRAAAAKNGKLLMIGFVLRFMEECIVAKDFIDNDYLGDIYYSKATYLRRHGAPGGWFTDKAYSSGGPVIDLGVHVIDLTRYLMGRPKVKSVFASVESRLGKRDHLKTNVGWMPKDNGIAYEYNVEDLGVALIKYDGGQTTLLETSYSLNGESKGTKELYGTKGGMLLDNGLFKIFTEYNGYLADVTPSIKNRKGASEGFTAEMQHFVDCILGKCECIATADDGIEIMKILDAIYESGRTGHEVVIAD